MVPAAGFGGAAAVVRHDHAIGAVFARELGVLGRIDAFQHQLHPVIFFSRST